MRLLFFVCAALLAGCAAGIDRNGKPIDPMRPVTIDTSPASGRSPTADEAKGLIQGILNERQQNVVVRSMHEAAYITPLGKVESGWLVCYNMSGTNVFGGAFSVNAGNVIRTGQDGKLEATSVRDAKGVCR